MLNLSASPCLFSSFISILCSKANISEKLKKKKKTKKRGPSLSAHSFNKLVSSIFT